MNALPHGLSFLENAVAKAGGIVEGRCPVCALNGGDRSGNHLRVYPDGRVHCIVDPEHWREARKLLGMVELSAHREKLTPMQRRLWAETKRREEQERGARERLERTIRDHRVALIERWAWHAADVWEDSPLRLDGPHVDDPRSFLRYLFPPNAIVWTGQIWASGKEHGQCRWRTVAHWQDGNPEDVGPMVCPATWEAGTVSRKLENVATWPYVVLDFDGPKGWRPASHEELERHVAESLAIVRWIREGLDWELAAMVWTGSKSVHAWFHHPGQECVKSLVDACEGLGIDKGLVGHPEHPARLPGHRHAKTGDLSELLWLDWRNFSDRQ